MNWTDDELALFRDLDETAQELGIELCLIGAVAIRIGLHLEWESSLGRMTQDFDFVVRLGSSSEFQRLTDRLTIGPSARFTRSSEPHRFEHTSTRSLIDIVPFGAGIEDPPGNLRWPDDDREFSTVGLDATTRGAACLPGAIVAHVRFANLPAVAALKVFAYRDRRTRGIKRDIQDVLRIATQYQRYLEANLRIEEVVAPLQDERVSWGAAGAYLLGLDIVRSVGESTALDLVALLPDEPSHTSREVVDALVAGDPELRSAADNSERLRALRLGMLDALASLRSD